MKILFIINKLLNTCGVTSHCYYLVSGLVKRHDIKLSILCGGGDSIQKFRELGIEVIVNEKIDHRKRSYFGYLKAMLCIYQIIRKTGIDIVHSHHHYAASIASKVTKITKTKTILTNHGLLPEIGILNHFAAEYIIAVNNHVSKYLLSKQIKDSGHFKLIRSGFAHGTNLRTKKDSKIKFIAASRLNYGKGLDIYIKAVNLLPDIYKNRAEFYLAGEGESESELINLIQTLNVPIFFLGKVINLSEELKNFDVFVIPFRSTTEGFPMTIIEAGFNKNVIITSNFLGLSDVFKEKEDGIVFKQDDIDDLAEKIKYVLDNFNDLNYLIENFYKKATQIFSADKMVSETIDLYNKILEK